MTRNTVMIVEDDDDLRDLVVEVLQRNGCDVRAASSGNEALDIVDAVGFPDLILLDMRMPGMNGMELAAELRRRDCPSTLVVMTAAADARARAAEIHADGWVAKPFSIRDLVTTVRRFLSDERTRASSPSV